jgi:hypothetical protein
MSNDMLATFVRDIDWGAKDKRVCNALYNDGIDTVGDLIVKTEGDLLRISGFGKGSLEIVKSRLASMGLQLADDRRPDEKMAMTDSQDICGRCRYWEFHYSPSSDYAVGECRRHAPQPIQQVLKEIVRLTGLTAWAIEKTANIKHSDDDVYLSQTVESYEVHEWPITSCSDWCGEFAPTMTTTPVKDRDDWGRRLERGRQWAEEMGLVERKSDECGDDGDDQ